MSKISELFTGDEKVAQARTFIEGTNNITDRTERRKYGKKLEEANSVIQKFEQIRRWVCFAAMAAIASVTVIVAKNVDTDGSIDNSMSNVAISGELEPIFNQEMATDALIIRVEQGFEHFKTVMIPKMQNVSEPKLREELNGPFDLIELNKKFPNRNGPRFDRESLAAGNEQNFLSNPYYFTYASDDKLPAGNVASFTPPSRRLSLSDKFDSKNLLDMVILYHELRHAIMDTNIQMNLSPEKRQVYLALLSKRIGSNEKFHTIVSEEAFAYGLELEMIDLYLDGVLRQMFSGGEKISSMDILQRLNARPDQLGTVNLLLDFAKYYYPDGIHFDEQSDRLSVKKRFMDAIAKKYAEMGMIPITFDMEKGFKPY